MQANNEGELLDVFNTYCAEKYSFDFQQDGDKRQLINSLENFYQKMKD